MHSSKLILVFLLMLGFVACNEGSGDNSGNDELIEAEDDTQNTDQASSEDEIDPADQPLAIWKSYHNERFDFCVEYPSNFLTPQGESQNYDGNVFVNANGSSEMRASGIFNALSETVEDAYERATEDDTYYEDERKITYKRQKDNWFVLSGTYYESIFYVKTALVRDTFYTLYFEYHPSEKEEFDAIIERNSSAFPDCQKLGNV